MAKTQLSFDTHSALLEAANRVIIRDGSSKLTLDAVAREASVSKGGLLYHFPNKEALILGMLENELRRAQQRMERDTNGTPGSWTRAYVQDTIPTDDTQTNATVLDEFQTDAALFAAIAENPKLLEPFRIATNEWQARTETDGIDSITANIVRLAADGYYFNRLFGLALPTGTLRAHVLKQLLVMASTPKAQRKTRLAAVGEHK